MSTQAVASVLQQNSIPFVRVSAKYGTMNSLLHDVLKGDVDFDPYNRAHLELYWNWVKEHDQAEYDRAEDVTGWSSPGPENIHESIMDGEYTPDPASVANFVKTIDLEELRDSLREFDEGHTQFNLELRNKKQLPPTTWVVHFTDDVLGVARDGFKYGADDAYSLGLTRHKTDASRHNSPGYNFGYELCDSDNNWSGRRGVKYGNAAVMFQTAGSLAYHKGDEERQVIFWGPNVEWVIPIVKAHVDDYDKHSEDDYAVLAKDGSYPFRTYSNVEGSSTGGRSAAGNFNACAQWVVKNINSYRRSIIWELPKSKSV